MIFISSEIAYAIFLLVINSNLTLISHRLATIHPSQTDRQTDGQTTIVP